MNVTQYLAASSRVYRRARDMQTHLLLLARTTRAEGFPIEADGLEAIAGRAIVAANRYCATLAAGVW